MLGAAFVISRRHLLVYCGNGCPDVAHMIAQIANIFCKCPHRLG